MNFIFQSLLVIEAELCVEDGKHSLIECRKEVIHGFFQVQFSFRIIVFQIPEEIRKDFTILLVEDAVGSLEHVVEITFRVLQKFSEEFCI